MGLIGAVLGNPSAVQAVGAAAASVAEVFTPNATRAMEAGHEAWMAAMGEHGEEFRAARPGRFDALVNGLNRLPRPMLALGTLGLFGHAMVSPEGFARRMEGLNHVPEPLWWLLGAVVSFYFGAREAHYFRSRAGGATGGRAGDGGALQAGGVPAVDAPPARSRSAAARAADNAALDEWRDARRD